MSLPGRFVDATCGRIFVHRAGRGEPLVLIHGFFVSHWYFRHVLPRLAEKHDVIALDLPGFGESDRPAPDKFNYDLPSFAGVVAEVMDALSLPRADVLGHSMGGGVALTLAARDPDRVSRLALCCATVYPIAIPAEGKLLLQPVVGPFLWRHAFRKADIKRVMIRDQVRDPRFADDEFVDYYWARLNRPGGREATYASMQAIAALADSNADPGRVTAPTLVLWADEDRIVPLAHGKRLQRAIAGAELRVVPASGHMPFLERPDEFLRQLEPFLDAPAHRAQVAPVPSSRSRAS
ncbi:MAG TPA: alpha/beta fold hydrolase [Polyangia bacterium]|nr:alpha/beta fold hydrolase [Polyangia bacterium]